MQFTKILRKTAGSVVVTIPADIVKAYNMYEGDTVELDIIRVHHK